MTTRPSAPITPAGFSGEENNGSATARRDPQVLVLGPEKLDKGELERRFTEMTRLLYTTKVPVEELREKVYPHLAPTITFKDPWIRGSGLAQFWTGLRGFHAIIHFDFDVAQLAVQLNERGDGGRVLVDGVMNLRQLVVYTYPLRTQLVYEFTLSPEGDSFQITSLEEMWSFGDLFQNLPAVGIAYEAFRWSWGAFFTGVFWTAANVVERLPWERARNEEARVIAG